MAGYRLAKNNKSFSDGVFVQQCLIDFANVLCPDMRRKFQTISLSSNTIAGGINLISDEQLNSANEDFVFL